MKNAYAGIQSENLNDSFAPNVSQHPPHQRPPSPLLGNVSTFQKILFGWAWPLLKLGSQRPLEESDLPHVHPIDSSAFNKEYISNLWNASETPQQGLGRAVLKDYFQTTRFPQLILVLNSASKIGQAIALGFFMEQFTSEESTTNNGRGYIWCAVLVLCGLVAFPTKQHLYFQLYRKGMQIRVGIVAALYDKALRLSSTATTTTSAENSITAGKLTNLASNDVNRFLSAAIPSLYLMLGPIEALVVLIVGMYTIGAVFAVGHGLFLLLIPMQIFLGRRCVQFRSQVANITDARVTLVSQAVSGARIMKMNAWELEFERRIAALRAQEVAKLRAASRYKAVNDAIYYFSSIVVAVAIFSVHVLQGNELTPRNVYTTLTLLNILHLSLTKNIPNAVMHLSECSVSADRIQAFLELPENSTLADSKGKNDTIGKAGSVFALFHVSCIWDNYSKAARKQLSNIALSDITLSFGLGQLYGIVGKVGSGKSALLQLLAGELIVTEGDIARRYSSLSYASQDAWIINGSVRENIVMGRPFQKEWYDRIVDACGLRYDLSLFYHGDETIVGDRGIQLSGGQRARIGLARAFFGDPQVLLLDDPLSAVDSTLARSIFQEAIQELGIKKGKCIIMATHQHQFFGNRDHIIVLENGKVISAGSRLDLTEFHSLTSPAEEEGLTEGRETETGSAESINNQIVVKEDMREHMEKRSTGILEWETWAAYGNAAGGFGICFLFFLFFSITQSCLLVLIAEVGSWAEAPREEQSEAYWFAVILGISLGLILLSIVRAQLSFHLLIGVSQRLHDKMLRSVLRSKIEFFDMNPLGRILNRFSTDVGISDETLPLTIYDFLVGAFIVVGGVVTASIVMPFVLVALPALVWVFVALRKTFVMTTRELKRLEGISCSPIFSMMSESLQGVSSIRANNFTGYFRDRFEDVHDANTRSYFAFVASSRWFATRMDILSFVLLASASILAVLFHNQGWFRVNPTVLGLALTILLQIAGTNFPWIVRQSAEIVNQMISVERILEFGKLEPEAALDLTNDTMMKSTDWPGLGKIVAKDLSVRYRPTLPFVLKKISFEIPPGSRVGIVGRTGSGKSTFVQSLFRLLEAQGGTMEIDGVDTTNVGLHVLRSGISVIPQNPTLFSGISVRENLDIFGNYSEEAIEEALKDVQMHERIAMLPQGYDSLVAEGGSNFSVGQRQLLCLARANLKKNRIVVLDEATASVDRATDRLLHKSLNETYKNATILKIAHRLDTVIEDDYILVLGDGKVLEFDSPANLLLESNGALSQMVRDTGETMAGELKKRAFSKAAKVIEA